MLLVLVPSRFLEHVKNEESPLPPIGNHHAFFSDDQEATPVTEIADLIHDSYEVKSSSVSTGQISSNFVKEKGLNSTWVFQQLVHIFKDP